MFKKTGIVITVLGLAVVFLSLWELKTVTVTLPRESDRRIFETVIDQGDEIRLKYRHSVELTWVEGRFRVDKQGQLRVLETRMASVGTGLPDTAAADTRLESNQIIVDEKKRPLPTLRFYILPINQAHLTIAGKPVDLKRLTAGVLIEISVVRVRAIKWLFGRFVLKRFAQPRSIS